MLKKHGTAINYQRLWSLLDTFATSVKHIDVQESDGFCRLLLVRFICSNLIRHARNASYFYV